MDVRGAVLRTIPVARAVVSLKLIACLVHHSHVVWFASAALGLSDDVIKVDVVGEQDTLSDLLLANTAAVPLLDP